LTAGYGYYVSGNNERGVIPVGLGLEYEVAENLALNFEVSGRFGVNEVRNGQRLDLNVMSSVLPGIGITYRPEKIERRPPGPTPVEGEAGAVSEGEFEGRSSDSEIDSPFSDPVSGSQVAIQKFDIPYTLDSLKNAEPLIVERGGPAPHEDPGQTPIAGSPNLANDGKMVRRRDGALIRGLTEEDHLEI
jgi:hypothetical protein